MPRWMCYVFDYGKADARIYEFDIDWFDHWLIDYSPVILIMWPKMRGHA